MKWRRSLSHVGLIGNVVCLRSRGNLVPKSQRQDDPTLDSLPDTCQRLFLGFTDGTASREVRDGGEIASTFVREEPANLDLVAVDSHLPAKLAHYPQNVQANG